MSTKVVRPPDETPVRRRAARVLLLDDAGRVLLLHGRDPDRPGHEYWFTVGGGLEPGEGFVEAAVRELREETGLDMGPADLTGPVWRQLTEFPFGGRWYAQEQEFFVAHAPDGPWAFSRAGFDEIEAAIIDRFAWWSVAELEATGERYYPGELAAVLREILEA